MTGKAVGCWRWLLDFGEGRRLGKPKSRRTILLVRLELGYGDQFGIQQYGCVWVWDNALSLWYKDSSQLFNYSTTSSIGDSELPHLFVQVFPNPCRNQISIDFESNENECADYQIFSVTGKLVDAGSVGKANPISVEKLNSGLYLIQAQCGSRIYMGKFIKY